MFARRTAVMATLTAIIASAAVFAPSASAAPIYAGYDNTDPSSTGCSSNAITYWTKNLVNPANGQVTGVMELRYSRSCKTNWVRVNNYVQGATATKTIVRYRQDGPDGALPYASDVTSDTVYGVSYGMQLYAPAGVCVQMGAVLRVNGQTVGQNGQGLDQVC